MSIPVPSEKFVLFLNSNPWFSAVSDYSLQMCLYLQKRNKHMLYGAEKGSTEMDKKCAERGIPFFYVPIHNVGVFRFLMSFFILISLLSKERERIQSVVVFEGREHTLMILSRIFFPFLWYKKTLVRVRGQSQEVKKTFFSVMAYKYYTDKIVFAAPCVLQRVQFVLPSKKYCIQYYCAEPKAINPDLGDIQHLFPKPIPALNTAFTTWLVLGRFDPVKGHGLALQSFFADTSTPGNLIFVGKDETLRAVDILGTYATRENPVVSMPPFYYFKWGNKAVYLINDYFPMTPQLMAGVHFGLIPSLGSEVICRVGVEFLQQGTPCLYANTGALPDVFSDFPNLQFNVGHHGELSERFAEADHLVQREPQRYAMLRALAAHVGKEKYGLQNFGKIEALNIH